jgi:hypothetical protein
MAAVRLVLATAALTQDNGGERVLTSSSFKQIESRVVENLLGGVHETACTHADDDGCAHLFPTGSAIPKSGTFKIHNGWTGTGESVPVGDKHFYALATVNSPGFACAAPTRSASLR